VSPDVSGAALKGMWAVTQSLIASNRISAGHDISDGGIATTLCEMAFAGKHSSFLMLLAGNRD
jgi:phosphoribosylformylglycinamidine synthase